MNIVNVKSGAHYDIYCGRANKTYNLPESKWKNPFVIGVDGSRAEVIAKYEVRLLNSPELLADLHELVDKILGCFCNFPLEDCHCRVLIEFSRKFAYIKDDN